MMKVNIENLQDTLEVSYQAFLTSRRLYRKTEDYYHNYQYTREQLAQLKNRRQPAETFNIIKLFSRALNGYFDATISKIRAVPKSPDDNEGALNLSDAMDYILENNNYRRQSKRLRLDAYLAGLQVRQIIPYKTGEKDKYGREITDIKLIRISPKEIFIDPLSTEDDYSDARFVHRYKWISKENFENLFGVANRKKMDDYYNHISVEGADFENRFFQQFQGKHRNLDNYMIIHSEIVDEKGVIQSVYWCENTILKKEPLKYSGKKFTYLINKLGDSDFPEYYGIFNEVIETQDAINQALLKLQLLVNTNKVLVEKDALPAGMNMRQFQKMYERVSSVIGIERIDGIKVENLSADVVQQYTIIDKGFDRIKRILHINDSFLGMAFASDSGRKVKLQQNQTIAALGYLVQDLEFGENTLGWDLIRILQRDYNFTFFVKRQEMGDTRWIELNQPVLLPQGIDNQGQIIRRPIIEEVDYDEETSTSIVDYVIEPDTDMRYTKVNIKVETTSYNETDEADRLMLEQVIQGPAGQVALQIDPAAYMHIVSLSVRGNKTRNSEDVADIFTSLAQRISGVPTQDPRQAGEQQRGLPGTQGGETPAAQAISATGLANSLQQ